MSKNRHFFLIILSLFLLLGLQRCTRETEIPAITEVSAYYPVQPGKYIIYNLDSTVYTNYGTVKEIRRYQVKDLVDAEITDNQGRRSFRIRRQIRDSLGRGPWTDNAAFMVTPLRNSIEVLENNLRYIKLVSPVKDWYSWKGNTYIESSGPLNYLAFWDYTYADVGQPFSRDGLDMENTITVNQEDYATGDPITSPNNIAARIFSQEVYAKDIGLVFKDFNYWQYEKSFFQENCRIVVPGQAGTTACPYDMDCDSLASTMGGFVTCDTTYGNFSYNGYGIKLKMIDHN